MKGKEHSRLAHRAKAAEEKQLDSENIGVFSASIGLKDSPQMSQWLVNSGASSQMTLEKELLTDYKEFDQPENVRLGDGRTVDAIGVGNVSVNMLFRLSKPKRCIIHQVLFIACM